MNNTDRSSLKSEALANQIQRAKGPLGLAPHTPLKLTEAIRAGRAATPAVAPFDRGVSTQAMAARLQRATGSGEIADVVAATNSRHISARVE